MKQLIKQLLFHCNSGGPVRGRDRTPTEDTNRTLTKDTNRTLTHCDAMWGLRSEQAPLRVSCS